jgi:two-component system LytT family sensor kinase
LLFVPFIENAFKHGISYRDSSFIKIGLESDEKSVTFRCVNRMPSSIKEDPKDHKGIGLENASKRINLLFPDRHDLKVIRSAAEFEIYLKLKFSL